MENFKGLHSVTIKLIQSRKGDSIPTAQRVADAVIQMVDSGDVNLIYVHPQVTLETVEVILKDHFKDSISFREGVPEGCYGASTGKTLNGRLLYIDACEFPDRWTTGKGDEYTEWFNPLVTMKDAGWKLIRMEDEEQVDKFMETLEELGLEMKCDNTYNQEGQSETVTPLYTVDLKCIEQDKVLFVAAMFHHGGDPRGNYGSRYLFVCDGNDSFYEGLCPSFWGEEEK